jgi:hypothetical protein
MSCIDQYKRAACVKQFTVGYRFSIQIAGADPLREASMPSSSKPSNPEQAGVDWLGVKKTFVVQIIMLLAISGAAIEYINWSSSTAQAEFASAMELMMANSASPSQPLNQNPGTEPVRALMPFQIDAGRSR